MTIRYRLAARLAFPAYSKRRKAYKELRSLIDRSGLTNPEEGPSPAAEAISKHPLISQVEVTFVHEESNGLFRGGRWRRK